MIYIRNLPSYWGGFAFQKKFKIKKAESQVYVIGGNKVSIDQANLGSLFDISEDKKQAVDYMTLEFKKAKLTGNMKLEVLHWYFLLIT